MKHAEEHDYVIAGGGTAGCVLAARLAERGASVVLVERGPRADHPAIRTTSNNQLDALWRDPRYVDDVPMEPSGSGYWLSTLQGRTLGGGGAVNVMIHTRANRADFDEWVALGAKGWSAVEMARRYEAGESYHPPDSLAPFPAGRGRAGPIEVRRNGKSAYGALYEAAAMELGFLGPDWDLNGQIQQGGVGPYQFATDRNGARSHAAGAYLGLPGAAGVRILTGTIAARVEITDGGAGPVATGLVVLDAETLREVTIRAKKEVILCCGAFETPKLLMLSGVGPADRLKAIDVPQVVQGEDIGGNLQDHVITSVFFESRLPNPAQNFFTEIGLFTAMAPGEFGAFDNSARPDVQFFMNSGIASRRWAGMPENFIGFYPSLSRPKSRGEIYPVSRDPRRWPVVKPDYLSDRDDAWTLASAVRLAQRMANSAAFRGAIRGPISIGGQSRNLPEISLDTSEEDLMRYVRIYSRGLWHPAGTCRMGAADDETAPLDPELRVRGVGGLRVCDASAMPRIVTGNPNATVMAMAERAADLILPRASGRLPPTAP